MRTPFPNPLQSGDEVHPQNSTLLSPGCFGRLAPPPPPGAGICSGPKQFSACYGRASHRSARISISLCHSLETPWLVLRNKCHTHGQWFPHEVSKMALKAG